MEDKYPWLIRKVKQITGIDLESYKRPQMERRINSFINVRGMRTYEECVRELTENEDFRRKFIDHLTINVSEFFRNPSQWKVLADEVVPLLLKERGRIKAWSAGCSTGEEPYTLAMLLMEIAPGRFDNIMATDIDKQVLAKAQAGVYGSRSVSGLTPAQIKKYFNQQNETYTIKDEVKRNVTYKQHDLLKDPFPGSCDLILCRNVVIYFTEEAKTVLYERFYQSLRRGGVLFIGSTEQIFQAREIGLQSLATFFYQKL
ncbi:MAG: protein-glutamate O-methyltransferase CheR [Firmicutes bacterium]|nr:protein-glutamate O-methyltransferase CheR [Bacillota bacterium]